MRSYPLSFVLGGNYNYGTGKFYSQNDRGVYWSSTLASLNNAFSPLMYPSSIFNGDNIMKYGGFNLRYIYLFQRRLKPRYLP